MTIDYATFESTLETWFEGVTGLKVYWDERERKHERVKAWGLLNVISVVQLGVDEVRQSFDAGAPNGEQIEQLIAGNRVITVACSVKSRSQKPTNHARFWLSKLQTSLRDPSVLASFQAADIAVGLTLPLQNLDFDEENRRVSLATMDVQFATVVNEAILPTTWIEKVEVSSDIKDPGGVSIPASLQLDNLEMP